MQAVLQPIPLPIPAISLKPILVSLDSGAECSLQHWIEVCCLVEEEDFRTGFPAGFLDGEAADWQ